MKVYGIFGWWDDAVAFANKRARETGTRMAVRPINDRWCVAEAVVA